MVRVYEEEGRRVGLHAEKNDRYTDTKKETERKTENQDVEIIGY